MSLHHYRKQTVEKTYSAVEFNDRQVVRATASALRRALADRSLLITFGGPDIVDGRCYREDKLGSDFLRPEQLKHFSWMLRWRGQKVAIETAPTRASQTNPDRFAGLRQFPDVESYLSFLDGLTDWRPHDGVGLVELWCGLVQGIPEAAGSRIAHLYPDLRRHDEIAADIAAEAAEPVAETEHSDEPIPTEPASSTFAPPRTDLSLEARRYLDGI